MYEKAGGWYGDIMCERDGETYTFGTPNAKPFRAKKEAIEYVIGAMAQVIAVGDGKIKPVDSSGTPAEFIDFRLYNEFYVLPMTSVKVLEKIIELQKMKRDCTTEDVIDECRKVIHDEMSKPADIRDNSLIMDRMLALIACDVCMVNQPIGWEGDPLDMLVPAKEQ